MKEGRETSEAAPEETGERKKAMPAERWKVWAAVAGVVVVPTLLWASIALVPFLLLTTGAKLWVSGGLAIAAEGVFWISALLVGRELALRYRRRLDPRRWFRKR